MSLQKELCSCSKAYSSGDWLSPQWKCLLSVHEVKQTSSSIQVVYFIQSSASIWTNEIVTPGIFELLNTMFPTQSGKGIWVL